MLSPTSGSAQITASRKSYISLATNDAELWGSLGDVIESLLHLRGIPIINHHQLCNAKRLMQNRVYSFKKHLPGVEGDHHAGNSLRRISVFAIKRGIRGVGIGLGAGHKRIFALRRVLFTTRRLTAKHNN